MRQRLAVAVVTVALAATLLPGCTFLRDRSQAYATAQSTQPLVLPATPVRPITALNPIPDSKAVFPGNPDKGFVPPFPPSMQQVKATELPALPNLPGRSVVKLGTDGNGVAELRVIGPRERVWDELGRALKNAQVKIRDRDQSLGLVYISIDQQDYQVRMVRATEAFVISVQRNDETLAPVAVSRSLLTTLQVRWP